MLLHNLPERQLVVCPVKKKLVVIASDAQVEEGILPSAGAVILGGPISLVQCCFGEITPGILNMWGIPTRTWWMVKNPSLCVSVLLF